MKNGADHNQFIAAWRGIAVLIVVYYHYADRLPPYALGVSTSSILPMHMGKLGVFIFFIISGYLIAKSMAGCQNLSEFLAKRLSRIWPLYTFAAIAIFLFILVFPTPVVEIGPKQFNIEDRTVIDLVANILFLNDLGFPFIDGAFWSIVVEVKFYVIFGFFVVLFRSRSAEAFALFAVAIGFFDFLILATSDGNPIGYGGASGPLSILSSIAHRIFIAQYLPFFAVGVLLFNKNHSMIFSVAIGLSAVSLLIAIGEDMEFVVDDNIRFLLALVALLFVDHLAFSGRIIAWVGELSFSIYLFHQIVGLTIIAALAPVVGLDVAILLTLLIIFAVAAVASWLVEWRFRRQVTAILMRFFALVGLNKLKTDVGKKPLLGQEVARPARVRA